LTTPEPAAFNAMSALTPLLPADNRKLRADGAATKARLLDAVVECILEHGYYEASSNAIARQAGVTWGTIQHQFGTRQVLLLAVLERWWRRLTQQIEATDVHGDTLEERLACVMAVLETHYGVPEHLVMTQITLDLIQSPDTTDAIKRAVTEHGRELTRVWQPLFTQAMGQAASDEELVLYAFQAIRGYLSANTMAGRMGPSRHPRIRSLLLRGVAHAIREEAAAAGLDVGESPASGRTEPQPT
jgi:AcrR family transcriptional regulator